MDEKKIKDLMVKLDISRQDAIELISDDEQINKGVKLFELTDEQKKIEKQMRKTVKIVSPNGKKVEKPLKIDENRELLLIAIIDLLKNQFLIENIERPQRSTNKVKFKFNSDTFTITIAKERKKDK